MIQTTKRSVMNGYSRVLAIPYCQLWNLLRYEDPIAYTCGMYGKNADIYIFDNTVISTGNRPFGRHVDYKLIESFDKLAESKKTKEEVSALIKEFIKEAVK